MMELSNGNAELAVDNWVQNHNEWDDDPVDHSLTETTAGIDGNGTTYLSGDYRFIQEESATDLLDDLESRLQSFQVGLQYRVGYHACTHDEDSPQPCSWEQTRENGTVLSDIPELS
jgi:hypothetical protein